MKNIAILIITFPLFLFCSNKKALVKKNELTSIASKQSNCPTDGNCTLEIFKNKNLEVLKDDIGAIYYKMADTNNSSIIKYTYKRNSPNKNLQDGQYSEEVIFEINNIEHKIALNDINLQNTKMLFGRFCYCKGQAGYFKIAKGYLKLEKTKKGLKFNLAFTIDEVPQILKSITDSIN
jgi:hypothetical protein